MNFYLTNEHRKYFGLKPIKSNYDLIKLKKKNQEEYYLFFHNTIIVKIIKYFTSNAMIQMT